MDSKKTKKIIKDIINDRKEVISNAVDEVTAERIKLNKMAEKVRTIVGNEYVFILFLASSGPRVGDTLEVGDLIATFKKKKR